MSKIVKRLVDGIAVSSILTTFLLWLILGAGALGEYAQKYDIILYIIFTALGSGVYLYYIGVDNE